MEQNSQKSEGALDVGGEPVANDTSSSPPASNQLSAAAVAKSRIPVAETTDASPEELREMLAIRVVNAEGVGIPGAALVVYTDDDLGGLYYYAMTRPDGSVEVPCRAGVYSMTVNRKGGVAGFGCVFADVVVTSPVQEILIVLPRANCSLDVLVQDELGLPVSGVRVRCYGPAGALGAGVAMTDSEGVASWPAVISGKWHAQIESVPHGFHKVVGSGRPVAMLEPGAPVLIRMTLPRDGKLLLDLGALTYLEDLVGLEVFPKGGRKSPPWSDDGVMWSLPAGEYQVAAEWSPHSPVFSPNTPVTVRAGHTVTVALVTETGGHDISGRVTLVDGTPVPDANVLAKVFPRTFVPGRALAQKVTSTNSQGQWFIRGLPDGVLYFSVWAGGSYARKLMHPPVRQYDLTAENDGAIEIESFLDYGYEVQLEFSERAYARCLEEGLKVYVLPSPANASLFIERRRRLDLSGASAMVKRCSVGEHLVQAFNNAGDVVMQTMFRVEGLEYEGLMRKYKLQHWE